MWSMTTVSSGYFPISLAASGMRDTGASSVIGTFNCSQRFHNGGISGPRIQSLAGDAFGESRMPRKRCPVSCET